jgi:hypothetical protein
MPGENAPLLPCYPATRFQWSKGNRHKVDINPMLSCEIGSIGDMRFGARKQGQPACSSHFPLFKREKTRSDAPF